MPEDATPQPAPGSRPKLDKLTICVVVMFAFIAAMPLFVFAITAPLAMLARSYAMSGPNLSRELMISAAVSALLLPLLIPLVKGRKVSILILIASLVSVFAGEKELSGVLALFGIPAVMFFLADQHIAHFRQWSFASRLLIFAATIPAGFLCLAVMIIIRGPPLQL